MMRKVWMIEFVRKSTGRTTRGSFGSPKDRDEWLEKNKDDVSEYFVLDPGRVVKL